MTDSIPTQVVHSWRTTLRTAGQTIAGVILGLVAFILLLAVLAPQFLEALSGILPPDWYGWAATAVAFIGTLAGVVTKIMAIPGVNAWLTSHRLGATPKMIDAGTVGVDPSKITNL